MYLFNVSFLRGRVGIKIVLTLIGAGEKKMLIAVLVCLGCYNKITGQSKLS